MPVKPRPLSERLFEKVDASAPCWVFTGALDAEGYGRIGRGGRGAGTALTHRATWEILVGPIPERHDLDHLCRNRACCNPDHLEPVLRIENVRRGARRPGYRDSHCKNGHEYTPENTAQYPSGRRCKACQRASYIKRGRIEDQALSPTPYPEEDAA